MTITQPNFRGFFTSGLTAKKLRNKVKLESLKFSGKMSNSCNSDNHHDYYVTTQFNEYH